MAQLVVSWFICGGRFRVYAIKAIGQRKGRIIQVEEIDTRECYVGSAKRLEQLVYGLRKAHGELDQGQPRSRASRLSPQKSSGQ